MNAERSIVVLFRKRSSALFWRPGLSALIAVQGAFIVYLAGYYLFAAPDAVIVDMDFYQDYFAAAQLAHHQDIYRQYPASFPSLLPATNSLLTSGCFHRSAHPPFTALLFLPVAALPIRIALVGWLLVSLLLLGSALFVIKQELFPTCSSKALLIFLALLLFSYAFMENILTEQLTILLFFLIVLAWKSARRGQQGRAGVFLAVAALIHLTPALFLAYLAWKRQWRAVITAVCTAGLAVVGGIAWLPLSVYWRYFTEVSSRDVSCWAAHFDNKSLLGFFSRLLPAAQSDFYYPPPSQVATALAFLLSGALLLLCLWLFRRRAGAADAAANSAIFDHEWGLLVIAMLLISPLTWSHSLLMLCLPLLLLLNWIRGETGARRVLLQRLVALSVLLVFITPNMLNVSPLFLPLQGAFETIIWPSNHAPLWQVLFIYPAGLYALLLLVGIYAWYRVAQLPRLLAGPPPQAVAEQERKREQV